MGMAHIVERLIFSAVVVPMTNQRFPKQVRLLRPSEFERVFAARSSAESLGIVVYGAANEIGHPRLGLVVSRRIGGAVARNRWKRLLREAFRIAKSGLPPLDLVCVVRGQSPPPLAQMVECLPALVRRIELRLQKVARHSRKESP
jgi:ribonuclease P protein component